MKEEIEDFRDLMRDISIHHDLNVMFCGDDDYLGIHLKYKIKNIETKVVPVRFMDGDLMVYIYQMIGFSWDMIFQLKVNNKYHEATVAVHEAAEIKECKHCIIS